MLRLKVIACDVFNREINYLSSQSECYVDIAYLHQGLHNTPDKLREMVQEQVNKANEGFPYNYYNTAPDYDYIILGYGLCSNGIVDVSSSRVPMVVPKGHDCITMLLGSKERYKDYFNNNPGTYWFSAGWIERAFEPSEERYNATYKEYLDKYGEDNAEYLMSMEQSWYTDYKNAAYVSWDCIPNSGDYRDFTKKSAEYLKWTFSELEGDNSLLKRLLNGEFNENEVLIVPPGKKVVPSYDENIIKCE